MNLETASQIASIISPIVSFGAILSVFVLYKIEKKFDLEVEVRCDFSAWVASVQNTMDQDLLYGSFGQDLMLDLDRIQTKTFLCRRWVEEVKSIIDAFNNWKITTLKNQGAVAFIKEQAELRATFFSAANQLRIKLREQEVSTISGFVIAKFKNFFNRH